jgi:hypothetical protein
MISATGFDGYSSRTASARAALDEGSAGTSDAASTVEQDRLVRSWGRLNVHDDRAYFL